MALARDYIGPYQVVRLLNSGQSCQVWETIHTATGKKAVVKSLQRAHLNNSESLAALKLEFDVGQSLKHPNVIAISEFQSDRNGTYLVMEMCAGRNLKQYLREGHERLAFLAAKIIQQAASGLEHLHSKGWVHRDIKPDNFLVTSAGDVKLIDFSIAAKARSGGFSLSRLLGGKAKVQGTRSYMSPEQIRAEALDARADIYSFGCTIFELIGGRTPYTAGNPNDLLNKHLKSPIPPLTAFNDNVTPEFSALVSRMLHKNKAERPASCGDFLKEFQELKLFKKKPVPPANWDTSADDAKK